MRGSVIVLYVKGGGQRPTHNYAENCTDIAALSRLLVLIYTKMGDNLLSPLTVSMSGGPSPDSPSFLFLRPENLLTSLDSMLSRSPIQDRILVQPGLFILTVSLELAERYAYLEQRSSELLKAMEVLTTEVKKRKKQDGGEDIEEQAPDGDPKRPRM